MVCGYNSLEDEISITDFLILELLAVVFHETIDYQSVYNRDGGQEAERSKHFSFLSFIWGGQSTPFAMQKVQNRDEKKLFK